jgi:hypothetical protein
MRFIRNNVPDENKWNRKWLQKRTLNIDRTIQDAVKRQQWRKEPEIQ